MPLGSLDGILRRARQIADTIVAKAAESVDRDAVWPDASVRALQAAGLAGLIVPRSMGGLGQGLLALTQVCETIGRQCASSAICFGMHCVGSAVIAAKATDDQKQRYVAAICRGEHLTTLALSEPGSGVHFYLPQAELGFVADDMFRLNGAKAFVTNGGMADSYVVSTVAVTDGQTQGQLSCVVVQGSASGITWGEPWLGFGMRGNCSRAMDLRAVPVPRADLLGREGDQTWYVFEIVTPNFLMAMAGTYLGVADAAVAVVRDHMRQRVYSHDGASVGQQVVPQHRLGQLWAELEKTRQFAYFAAAQADAGAEDSLPLLCSAKAEVAECVVRLTNEAMTLMGGTGYHASSRLGRLLRDARAAHVMSPTTDLLRTWTGRALLGQPLLAD